MRLLLRPSMFLLHIPAIAAIIAAVLLGRWQYSAWQDHRQDTASELAEAEPLPLAHVLGPDQPFPGSGVGQPVTFDGSWLPETTVYIANKEHDGRTGYWQVTSLATCGTAAMDCAEPAAMPVVLGWTPEPSGHLPPRGDVSATGWLQPGEAAGETDADPQDDVLPTLRIAELLQRSDRDLYGGYVILEEPSAARGALTPVTPASLPDPPTFTALRNLLYGVEWWLFAGCAAFLWWRWTRDELAVVRAEAMGAEAMVGADAELGAEEDVRLIADDAEEEPTGSAARIPSEP